MQIHVNGKAYQYEKPITLAVLLQQQGIAAHYAAVAVNKQVIPRSQFEQCYLAEGDKLDVLTPMQGG